MDLHSSIHPAALDLVLGSAGNAVVKGQSQYSTPPELAAAIAQKLPPCRPVLIDLTCGPGQLLAGAANDKTEFLLGCDVDPRRLPNPEKGPRSSFIHADLCALYPLMRQIDFRADCFVLNPPWSLNWRVGEAGERLGGLADSEVPAVAKTFKAVSGPGHVDSTLATLMIALDRLTEAGEGILIGYTSTLERLLFAPGAPARLLSQHIWHRTPVPNCAMDPNAAAWLKPDSPFSAATVLYFSASHESGPTADGKRPTFLSKVNAYNWRDSTIDQWKALAEKVAAARDPQPKYHLSLFGERIKVRLGLFDTELVRVDRELARTAERLRRLDSRNPMQVVMQRDERNFILGLVKGHAVWSVEPALREAVNAAHNEYNAARAPLVPLPKIQRLGYLDEQDDILCVKDLGPFKAGVKYALSSRSMRFTRKQFKPTVTGGEEELELSGQELAILIQPADGGEPKCFMDASLRAANVKIGEDDGNAVVDFTLQELVNHFEIPEVPDIATVDPARYCALIEQLHRLEQLTIC
jgi:hypothetical protein